MSEYALVRFLTSRRLSRSEVTDWNDRFKKMGVNVSTVRMVSSPLLSSQKCLRMFNILQVAKFVKNYQRKDDRKA